VGPTVQNTQFKHYVNYVNTPWQLYLGSDLRLLTPDSEFNTGDLRK